MDADADAAGQGSPAPGAGPGPSGAAVDRMVGAWPVPDAGVAWCALDRTGPGPAGRPGPLRIVGAAATRFRWASVTKLATALAILVAVEEGTTALDGPAGPPGSTVRHLLAHASGLGPDDASVPVAPPARRRIYSNAGYAALGRHLADRAGIPFATYLDEAVLTPLGMTATRPVDLTGAGGPDLAVAGLAGPVADLAALAREWAAPSLISEATWREATRPQWPDLDGVLPGFGRFTPCPWGLGPEVRGEKQPHWTGRTCSPATFGHFGQQGAFVWIDPEAGLAVAGAADRSFGPWAARAWPELADRLVAARAGGPGQV